MLIALSITYSIGKRIRARRRKASSPRLTRQSSDYLIAGKGDPILLPVYPKQPDVARDREACLAITPEIRAGFAGFGQSGHRQAGTPKRKWRRISRVDVKLGYPRSACRVMISG